MCCCIPLRKLCSISAGIHLIVGIFYYYVMGSAVYSMYLMREKEAHEERLLLGLLYIGFYAAFLPPGIFIFYGVYKQIRCYLKYPTILFFLIQTYGCVLQCIYNFTYGDIPEIMLKYNQQGYRESRQTDWWMDTGIDISLTLCYVFMLFFYYREIGPEDNAPIIQSRYAQSYQQQLQQQVHQVPLTQSIVPFRPPQLCLSNTNLNSTPPPFTNLTYEQQQQLLKLQQHPLILQQFQSNYPREEDHQMLQQHHYHTHPYAEMMQHHHQDKKF